MRGPLRVAPSRGHSPTPDASTGWSSLDVYTPQDLPESVAGDVFNKGVKAVAAVVKGFSRKFSVVGWLAERREESLLEMMRLDATPPQDEPCTLCRMAGKSGPVLDADGDEEEGREGEREDGDQDATDEEVEAAEVRGGVAAPRGDIQSCGGRTDGGADGATASGGRQSRAASAQTGASVMCRPGRAEFRCEDCRFAVLCQTCVARSHFMTPFHRIEKVNGPFWERVQRKEDIGISVQLGHDAGEECFMPKIVRNFSVMHTNGIHRMTVKFCRCRTGEHLDEYTQLLRARLWPATIDEPLTATTFEAMDDFSRLSLLGRLSAYDYYKAMRACTDAVGLLNILPLLKQFTRGARQFQHIFLFKRAGRAYEGGIYSTPSGACAIECPGCARDGVNVKDGYRSEPNAWVHDRHICVDANFRLANKLNASTDQTDPSLTDGRAYVVASQEFKQYCDEMEKDTTREKPSDCSRFGAMEFANSKGGRYMRSTGVAGVFCARHDMLLPQAMGQLKVGERYSVVDFCVANAHRYINVECVVISYDIACQWSKNLIKRMKAVDPKFTTMYEGARSVLSKTLDFVVPKFHLFAHKVKCWFSRFNLAYLPFVGQTDGEGCERFWAGANPAVNSVREMGPGSVRDHFDSMWDSWNFRKVCEMGAATLKKLTHALEQAESQAAEYNALRAVLRAEDAKRVDARERAAERWEAAGRVEKDCPYQIKAPDVSLSQLKRAVAQEDARKVAPVAPPDTRASELADGEPASAEGCECEGSSCDCKDSATCSERDCHDVTGEETVQSGVGSLAELTSQSANSFDEVAAGEMLRWLLVGVNIEDTRRRLAAHLPDDDGAVSTVLAGEETLLESLQQFRREQERFMPETFHNLTPEERTPELGKVHSVALHLPSQLGKKDAPAPKPVAEMEARVRLANMHGALEELKRFLHLRVQFNKFKIRQITGQHMNTTARAAQETTEKRITGAAAKYRRHREAYLALVGPDPKGWEVKWKVLLPSDCVGLGDAAIKALESMERGVAAKALRDHSKGTRKKLGEVKGKKKSSGTSTAHVSWIWYNAGDLGEGLELTEDLLVELLKARARAQRWIEQVIRLLAESDRLIETDLHDAKMWEDRAEKWAQVKAEDFNMRRPAEEAGKPDAPLDRLSIYDGDQVLMAGLRAYAYKQAHYRRLRAKANMALRETKRRVAERFLKKYGVDGLLLNREPDPPLDTDSEPPSDGEPDV
ncbi:unnamed protein product [Peniophora sp. CBMAI 1063]|nr:unnamed protein product [Peniophora sp. CBMAI 1063]